MPEKLMQRSPVFPSIQKIVHLDETEEKTLDFSKPSNSMESLKRLFGDDLENYTGVHFFPLTYPQGFPEDADAPFLSAISSPGYVQFDAAYATQSMYHAAKEYFPTAKNFLVFVGRDGASEDKHLKKEYFEAMEREMRALGKKHGPWSEAIFDVGVVYTKHNAHGNTDRYGDRPGVYYFNADGFMYADSPERGLQGGSRGLGDLSALLDMLMGAATAGELSGGGIPSLDDLIGDDNPHKKRASAKGSKRSH